MDRWAKIELVYDDDTINHIHRHNVTISTILHVLMNSKKMVTNIKKQHYAIIGEYFGRCLVIILTKTNGTRFRLRTARDCNSKEKKGYSSKYKS